MTDNRRILALSSSRVGNSGYLEKAMLMIGAFLGEKPLNIAFIPFAYVDKDTGPLVHNVRQAFSGLPHRVIEITPENIYEVASADVIMVSGGNTFKLLHDLYNTGLLKLVQEKVNGGIPYIGWSAGANITGATICTTNDMPIIEPESFKALGFFPFQINPHYYNVVVEGFNGETRDQRLEEFMKLKSGAKVIGLPEGTALLLDKGVLRFTGEVPGIMFTNEAGTVRKVPIRVDEDLSGLMGSTVNY